jgi:hypothetical protein
VKFSQHQTLQRSVKVEEMEELRMTATLLSAVGSDRFRKEEAHYLINRVENKKSLKVEMLKTSNLT